MSSKRKVFSDLFLATLALAISFASIEYFFRAFPRLIPNGILMQMSLQYISSVTGNNPKKLVERLEDNPWLKFKPNVEVADHIWNGEVDTFSSLWKTDSLGFKNEPDALKSQPEVVLLGDSHVEGFGVSPDKTMAGILRNKFGISAYSLGVEGYGPQQSYGSMEKFGVPLKPKYVFFIQNGNFFSRAYELERGRYTGLINSRLIQDEKLPTAETEMTWRDKSFWVASYRAVRAALNNPEQFSGASRFSSKPKVTLGEMKEFLRSYLHRYQTQSYYMTDAVADPVEQKKVRKDAIDLLKKYILKSKSLGQSAGFELVVLVIPTNRSLIELAYPDDYSQRIANTFIQSEYDVNSEIVAFSKANRIPVIDATPFVRDYLANRFLSKNDTDEVDFRDLPFFKIDGHPSAVAHEIYASLIKDFKNRNGKFIAGHRMTEESR